MDTKKFKKQLYKSLNQFCFAEDFTEAADYASGYINAIFDTEEKKLNEMEFNEYQEYVDKMCEAKNEALKKYCIEKGL